MHCPPSVRDWASAYLSRQRHSPAVDVDHAIGEVLAVLAEAHGDALGRRMRLAGWVVGT